MSSLKFKPHIVVHHTSRAPQPILPVNYGFFLHVTLPALVSSLSLHDQLENAFLATARRRAYAFDGPFGSIVAFEARLTSTTTVYLNGNGVFAPDPSATMPTPSELMRKSITDTTDVYVVGHREEEFCSLLPTTAGEEADDQNLELAKRFESLPDAIAASTETGLNVFEVSRESGQPVLTELLVDIESIDTMPFEGAYQLTDDLLAGPSFVGSNRIETENRIEALRAAGIECVISLASQEEMFWEHEQFDLVLNNGPFACRHFFPIHDGGVPSIELATVILNTIEDSIKRGQPVYLHCVGGRGRTGVIACCFAARHGVPTGQAVINWLAKRRYQFGLFRPSPENEEQMEYVRRWRPGM